METGGRGMSDDTTTAIKIETEEDDTVRVGMADIYRLLLEVRDEVREMRPLPPRVDDHETRIRALERKVWAAAGAAAAAGGVVGIIGQQLLA